MTIKKNDLILGGVIMIIIVSIIAIVSLKNDDSELLDPDTIDCISSRSVLYVSKTCSHCARQKELLSECLDQFEIVDCTSESGIEKCREEGITQVPTWVIHGKHYTGTKTIDQLIEIHQNECGVCADE